MTNDFVDDGSVERCPEPQLPKEPRPRRAADNTLDFVSVKCVKCRQRFTIFRKDKPARIGNHRMAYVCGACIRLQAYDSLCQKLVELLAKRCTQPLVWSSNESTQGLLTLLFINKESAQEVQNALHLAVHHYREQEMRGRGLNEQQPD